MKDLNKGRFLEDVMKNDGRIDLKFRDSSYPMFSKKILEVDHASDLFAIEDRVGNFNPADGMMIASISDIVWVSASNNDLPRRLKPKKQNDQ